MYKRQLVQSGRGIGGLFRSLFRVIKPIAKTIAKTSGPILKKAAKSKLVKKVSKDVLKTGVQSAIDTMNDVAEGKKISGNKITGNFKKLGKRSLKSASNTLQKTINDEPAVSKKKKYVSKKRVEKLFTLKNGRLFRVSG